ncbi:CHAT domain-containing protein [Larkinella sp. C7]|jgi:hypothetical protein|uniref:CHAT domain-containing protein n=1 Tax=Larkinella sp. C7 TaxID=2576607 RepID=UPI0011114922|nr:CHAT domain-containing protein [Larkinella sp. C7]
MNDHSIVLAEKTDPISFTNGLIIENDARKSEYALIIHFLKRTLKREIKCDYISPEEITDELICNILMDAKYDWIMYRLTIGFSSLRIAEIAHLFQSNTRIIAKTSARVNEKDMLVLFDGFLHLDLNNFYDKQFLFAFERELNRLSSQHEIDNALSTILQQAECFGSGGLRHYNRSSLENYRREINQLTRIEPISGKKSKKVIKTSKCRVLFLASDPVNNARLRLQEEYREINEVLLKGRLRNKFILDSRNAVRAGDITQAIHDFSPDIIHFSGHGSTTGIQVEDQFGNSKLIKKNELTNLFKLLSSKVSCVILNSCYSKDQADAIAMYIPFVIGIEDAISDQVAISFTVGFYKALAGGNTIPKAFEFGKVEIGLQLGKDTDGIVLFSQNSQK